MTRKDKEMDNNYHSVMTQWGMVTVNRPVKTNKNMERFIRFMLTTGIYIIMLVVSILLAIKFG